MCLIPLLSSCGLIGQKQLSATDAAKFRDARFVSTKRNFEGFMIRSAGENVAVAVGGAVGGAIAGAADNDAEMNRRIRNEVPSPTDLLRESLIAHFQNSYNVKVLESPSIPCSGYRDVDLSSGNINADFVIDVNTVSAQASSVLPDLSRYNFLIHFNVTITDVRTGMPVYSQLYMWMTPKNQLGYPKYEEFLTDPHKGVEAQIRVASACAGAKYKNDLSPQ
jgi:hypothetical protein